MISPRGAFDSGSEGGCVRPFIGPGTPAPQMPRGRSTIGGLFVIPSFFH